MWRVLRNTASRGRSAVPSIRFRSERCRFLRPSFLKLTSTNMIRFLLSLSHESGRGSGRGFLIPYPPPPPPPVAPALPTFFLITSSTYLTPLPLYGSGGRSSRTLAAVWPTRSRSALVSVSRFLSTLALTPL